MNVVWITMDAVRPDRLSYYGYDGIETRNIDKLASRSIVYTNAMCQAPYTPASHMSFLTGMNPPEHGVRDMWNCCAYPSVPLFSEIFKKNGYDTAGFVGLPDLSTYGFDRGFTYFDQDSNLQDWHARGRDLGNDWRGSFKSWNAKRDTDKPCFVWFHHFLTHGGSDRFIPKKYLGVGKDPGGKNMKNYDAKIKWFDEDFLSVILDGFDLEDTIVILTSDHGEAIFKEPKEEHRRFLFNDTLSIPLIISYPGMKPTSKDIMVNSIDVFPTVLEELGISCPKDVQGRNDILRTECSALSYAETRYKEIFRKSYTSKKYKVIHFKDKLEGVYDLVLDPKEKNNVAEPYCIQKVESPEIDLLNNKLKAYGGIGADSEINRSVEEDDSAEKMARLKDLGYM